MHRLRFSKTADAVWISHLDTMRLFQRAFRRADLEVRHTEGFNPHAFVSIAMPMSVGTRSDCELLDFTLLSETCTLAQLPEKLNAVLPAGVRVLEAYDEPMKLKLLKYLRARVRLDYDLGVPPDGVQALEALFAGPAVIVSRKTKKGIADTDILPMLRSLAVSQSDANTLVLEAVVCANEPSLNPDLLAKAVAANLPDLAPDGYQTSRVCLYAEDETVFR